MCGVECLPHDLSFLQKKFLDDMKSYLWEDPLLFKRGLDHLEVYPENLSSKYFEALSLIRVQGTFQCNKDSCKGSSD